MSYPPLLHTSLSHLYPLIELRWRFGGGLGRPGDATLDGEQLRDFFTPANVLVKMNISRHGEHSRDKPWLKRSPFLLLPHDKQTQAWWYHQCMILGSYRTDPAKRRGQACHWLKTPLLSHKSGLKPVRGLPQPIHTMYNDRPVSMPLTD